MNAAQKKLKLGRWLRAAREEAGKTQKEAAMKLGYTVPQFVSNFERGLAYPPIHAFAALVRFYKADRKEAIELYREVRLIPIDRDLGLLRKAIG